MTTKELMSLQKFRIFSFDSMFIPISVSLRYVKNEYERIYEWRELRIFGVLIAMWGAIG